MAEVKSRYSALMNMARALAFVVAAGLASSAFAQPGDYVNFESGAVRPLALSADGDTLYALNTPDSRLEIFDLTSTPPVIVASVPVGLDPVALALESATRVWVVNHLSDSISIVDVAATPPHVVQTLLVGDEPRDIVFAGPERSRAFITTAHRGPHSPYPRGEFNTPGVGRADVWVFEAATGSPDPLTILNLFGDTPRALAVSPDGSRVYASIFLSGNGTTVVHEGAVCDGGSERGACTTGPGGMPAPNQNAEGIGAPETGLIVRDNGTAFVDELGRDWSDSVRFDLPDYDVFEIDANAETPVKTREWSGVGTVNFAMAVHPTSGELFVANTEAPNEVRFEGPGTLVRSLGLREGQPATVRSHLHEARITVIDGDSVEAHRLNPHLDYEAAPSDDVRHRTLATPVAMAMNAAGTTLYVAALGSSSIGVIDVDALREGVVDTRYARVISLREPWPGGPVGLVLDEGRGQLYVLNRFDNSVALIDLSGGEQSRISMHTPEPAEVIQGRPVFYDALASSSHGEASCSSCHVFGDFDGLAWDLGNPDDELRSNPNPRGPVGGGQPFHPMKGPMTTQTFRGMSNQGPMHWRGDRTGGYDGDALDEHAAFVAFNGAFEGLLGREEGALTEEEMSRFADFALTITSPPNPIRQLDNALREDEERGRDFYMNRNSDMIATCNGCHVVDRSEGFFGTSGLTTFENETQHFKVPHIRNMYQKVGMFGLSPSPFFDDAALGNAHMGPQVRGFGYLHDGSTDTVLRFFHAGVFTGFRNAQEREDVTAFVMASDAELAPVVGQQTTGSAADSAFLDRADLFIARASAAQVFPSGTLRECDLVVHAVDSGELRGWLLGADGRFRSDRAGEPPIDAEALAGSVSSVLTMTCFPPGSGTRAALDRDGDGVLNGDELDRGSDPAERLPVAQILITGVPAAPTSMPPLVDAGVADAGMDASGAGRDAGLGDAGSNDAGVDGGLAVQPEDGCSVAWGSSAPMSPTRWGALMLLGAMMLRRRIR
ncbi:MAG: DNA-binding beta-propeller fold protein YncE [Polyangiales bacterium]